MVDLDVYMESFSMKLIKLFPSVLVAAFSSCASASANKYEEAKVVKGICIEAGFFRKLTSAFTPLKSCSRFFNNTVKKLYWIDLRHRVIFAESL